MKIEEMMKKLKRDRLRNNEWRTNERNFSINVGNQKLVNSLFEISCGKWSSIPVSPKRSIKKRYHRGSSIPKTSLPSLNIAAREKEVARIQKEN